MEKPVTFQSHGTQIVGILHTPETNTAKSPAVLLLHGFTATKSESHRIFVKTARALAKEGLTALRFDFRGWGDSGGDSEDSNISTMVSDAKAATDFLLSRAGVDPERLGYLGMSTGGAAAALAAGADPRVKTLALWNAVADGGAIIQGMITPQRVETLAQRGKADYDGNWVSQRFVQEFLAMKPALALAKRPIPTLLIQAMNDAQVHPSQADLFADALRDHGVRCEKMLVADSDHTFSSAVWEMEVIERTVEWFSRELGVNSR